MRKAYRLFLFLCTTGLTLAIIVIGCEEPSITEIPEQTDEQEWFSVVEEWTENVELSPQEEAILKDRMETAMKIKDEGMPKEIAEAWDKMKEDYKDFLGVEDLPKREIAPGTYSWVPEEYLKGEKQKELYDFLSDKFKNLNQLYHKHGLRESKERGKIPGDYDYDTFLTVYGNGSNQVQWGIQAWTESDEIVDFLALDGQIRKSGVWLYDYNPTAYNWWWVEEIDWGEEYANSMLCFSAQTIHTVIHNGSHELIPPPITTDYDCGWPGS